MNNQWVYTVMFPGLFLLLAATLALGAKLLIAGDYGAFALQTGLIGSGTFLLMFFGGIYAGTGKEASEAIQAEKNHEHFSRLLEQAEYNPVAFKRKLSRLGRLGNLYIAFLLFGILSSLASLLALAVISASPGTTSGILSPLIVAMLGVAYIVLKSLYVKTELTTANRINRREYPSLFAIIDKAALAMKVKAYEDVYLMEDNNCGVASLGHKEELSVGIHMLEMMDQDQLMSIMIHELAHVHHKDTKISYKISQNTTRWSKIGVGAAEKGFLARCLLQNFADYYVVKMQMHLAAMFKQQEYLADSVAVRHTNKEVFATAIGKLAVMDLFLNSPDSQFEIRDKPFPPADYYTRLFNCFYQEFECRQGEWTDQVMKRISGKYDSHPALKERLQNIGLNQMPPIHFNKYDSAHREEINKLVDVANTEWYVRAEPMWDEFSSGYRESCKIVQEYTPTDDFTINMDYAMALENLSREDEAIKVYDSILSLEAGKPAAMYRKGLLLLSRKDNSGIELLRAAMEADNVFINNGLNVLGEYLHANGMESKRESLRGWAMSMAEIAENKQDELETLYTTDTFVPANLELSTMLTIKGILRAHKEVSRGFLVQKVLQYTDMDYYVVAVILKSTCSKKRMQQVLDKIAEKLNETQLPYFLLNMNANPVFNRPITLIKSAEIFRR